MNNTNVYITLKAINLEELLPLKNAKYTINNPLLATQGSKYLLK